MVAELRGIFYSLPVCVRAPPDAAMRHCGGNKMSLPTGTLVCQKVLGWVNSSLSPPPYYVGVYFKRGTRPLEAGRPRDFWLGPVETKPRLRHVNNCYIIEIIVGAVLCFVTPRGTHPHKHIYIRLIYMYIFFLIFRKPLFFFKRWFTIAGKATKV